MLYAEVLKENAYLSRTVEVQKGQKVVDTGLYGIVRHPMYTITIFLFLSMPLVLGSLISFVVFLAYPVIIAKRIINEEAVLEKDLDGYTEYKKKVKYKIIPYGDAEKTYTVIRLVQQERISSPSWVTTRIVVPIDRSFSSNAAVSFMCA